MAPLANSVRVAPWVSRRCPWWQRWRRSEWRRWKGWWTHRGRCDCTTTSPSSRHSSSQTWWICRRRSRGWRGTQTPSTCTGTVQPQCHQRHRGQCSDGRIKIRTFQDWWYQRIRQFKVWLATDRQTQTNLLPSLQSVQMHTSQYWVKKTTYSLYKSNGRNTGFSLPRYPASAAAQQQPWDRLPVFPRVDFCHHRIIDTVHKGEDTPTPLTYTRTESSHSFYHFCTLFDRIFVIRLVNYCKILLLLSLI